jgi:hypothetical protein
MKIRKPKHYSPSSINLFMRDKAKFIMKYADIDTFDGSSATIRGQAVEVAISERIFYAKEIIECIDIATQYFESECKSKNVEQDEKYWKEHNNLSKYIENIIPSYDNIKEQSVGTQCLINLDLNDISVPIKGFIDFEFDNHIRDLKTTRAIPSKIPHSVARQLAIYSKAIDKKEAWVDYVSPKKTVSYRIDNIDDAIEEVRSICLGMDKFFQISDDVKELATIFYPNLDSYEWDRESINNAKQLWSIK